MKLEVKCCQYIHTDIVTAVAWTPENELYSLSDDCSIHRWDGDGNPSGKVRPTAMHSTGRLLAYPIRPERALFAKQARQSSPTTLTRYLSYYSPCGNSAYENALKKLIALKAV